MVAKQMKAVLVRYLAFVCSLVVAGSVLLPCRVSAQPQQDLLLTLVSDSYRVDTRAGQDSHFFLDVRNIGRVRVTGITLSSDWPEGWLVTFEPSQIPGVDSGAVATVTVSIRPPATVTKGEYGVRMVASWGDQRTVQIVPVRVTSAVYWLWVGIGATVALIAVFAVVFLRMGRRR
jgi:uncharacterized membrane protein